MESQSVKSKGPRPRPVRYTPWLTRQAGVKSGRPVVSGTGVLVTAIAERFAAGESVDAIATDYAIDRRAVEAAIRLVVCAACGARGWPIHLERRMDDLLRLLP